MRPRALTEHDRRAWASYAQQVTPRAGAAVPPPTSAAERTVLALLPPAAAPVATARRLASLEIGAAPGSVDRATWSKFRRGKLPPARTLDLHGHTLQRAHAELNAFLARAVAERLRCVEVITGRGSGESGGAIRREFPLWLNSPALRPLILAASHPHAANTGSVRLLLRRVR